jgi:hypothetical protein
LMLIAGNDGLRVLMGLGGRAVLLNTDPNHPRPSQ